MGSLAKHSRDHLPLSESESVGVHGGSFTSASGNVVVASYAHYFFGMLLQLVGVGGNTWLLILESACFVDFCLKGSIFPATVTGFWVLVDFLHGW